MSFGFSVSDIYGCAHLAYMLYNEFKQAPGACQEFARELLLFHQVLLKTKSTIGSATSYLSHADQSALGNCLDSCKKLLYVEIGAPTVTRDLEKIDFDTSESYRSFVFHSTFYQNRFFGGLRQKLDLRKFASRIPQLQRAISAHVEILTAYNVLMIQSSQEGIQALQKGIEDGVRESRDLLVKYSDDHMLQLESLANRLETSQSGIEAQLQAILANQQRTRTPIMSHSLDASSPEGRQTWMELGRLLRDEGITPAMIQENREVLVNAMKNTLKNEALAESLPESYATAPEYNSSKHTLSLTESRNASHRGLPPALGSISLLGSAPPRGAGFTGEFLERQSSTASSLDHKQNIHNGMRSLLEGMSDKDSIVEERQGDMDDVELENLELEEYPSEGDSFQKKENQRRDMRRVVERLVPTSKPGESRKKLESEGTVIDSQIPKKESDERIEWWTSNAIPQDLSLTASDVTGKDTGIEVDHDEDTRHIWFFGHQGKLNSADQRSVFDD